MATKPYCVGLTGGIGSGKSTVAHLLQQHGAALIDTDIIAHQLTGVDGQGTHALMQHFGADIVDSQGALNRQAMRQRVFNDAHARRDLESILHPLIRERVEAELDRATGPYMVLVVPLLVTAPIYRPWMQRILVVDCDEETQIARVMQRSAMREAEVRAIIAAQSSRAERLVIADDIIVNNQDLTHLQQDCFRLHQHYLTYAQLRNAPESSTMPKGG